MWIFLDTLAATPSLAYKDRMVFYNYPVQLWNKEHNMGSASQSWYNFSSDGRILNPLLKQNFMAKYSKKAGDKVEKAMHEKNAGTLKSGRSGKTVTSRKQAIAIGLSEAREEGAKVPEKKTAAKRSATKKSAPKKAAKKSTGKK